MSLKAGRVGVAPDQVDEFGKIKSEATSGYTKQEPTRSLKQRQTLLQLWLKNSQLTYRYL